MNKFFDFCASLFVALFQAGLALFGFDYAMMMITGTYVFPPGFNIWNLIIGLLLTITLLIGNSQD